MIVMLQKEINALRDICKGKGVTDQECNACRPRRRSKSAFFVTCLCILLKSQLNGLVVNYVPCLF